MRTVHRVQRPAAQEKKVVQIELEFTHYLPIPACDFRVNEGHAFDFLEPDTVVPALADGGNHGFVSYPEATSVTAAATSESA